MAFPGNTNAPPIMPYLWGPNGPNVQGHPVLPYFQPHMAGGFPANGTNAGIAAASTIPTDLGGGGGFPPDASHSGYPDSLSYPHMPWPDTGVAPAAAVANAPSPPPRLRNPGSGGAQIPATATASVPPAAAGPSMFGGIDRPNASATGWNPGTMRGTALDLSSMFGMPSDVNPAAAAQPVRGGALSKAGTKGLLRGQSISPTTNQPMPMSTADIQYGLPDARGAPYPYAYGSPRSAAKIAAAAKHSGFA
jgi:hypothetical protein